ncbi:ATP-binding protein [Microbacterium sp.]|uniref:ATP-binding protein n=1 Tax=Microbacterium sp. TaxID=51671 RepID=UPI002627B06F|nr:ATP-binding protein [Microbacterium sp.]
MGSAASRRLELAVASIQRTPRWWAWVLVALALFALSRLGVAFTPLGGSVAAWWPAAGVAAWFVLVNPRQRRWAALVLVFVATGLANATGERDLVTSVGFGLANAIEAGMFAALLDHRATRRLRLRSVRHAWRFALAVLAASSLLGILVGLVVLADGREFLPAATQAAASHAAAILIIAPFAVLPPPIYLRIPRIEVIAQVAALSGILVFLGAGGASLPLTFLPVGILAWGSFRFPNWGSYVETLLTGVAVLAMTVAGIGPFSAAGLDPRTKVLIVALFIFMAGLYNLFLSTASYELRAANRTSRDFAKLFTGGFIDSRVGLVIAERRGATWRALLANSAARGVLRSELRADDVWVSGPIREHVENSLRTGHRATFETFDGAVMTIDASTVTGDETRVAVQVFDITDSVHATQTRLDAERARATALAAKLDLERRQSDFVATASHELRTPIASIAGYLELIEESDELPPQSREWIEVVQRNTARLSYLIDDLLILARVQERTDRHFLIAEVAVADLFDEVLARYAPSARQRGLELSVGDCDGLVQGVPSELGHALASLVANAVKFTPRGGRVRVEASHDNSTLVAADGSALPAVRITVRDTGPGIADADLPHIFDRFYRTREAEQAHAPGTGLGLAVAQELAHANGGVVELSSPNREGVIAALIVPMADEWIRPAP